MFQAITRLSFKVCIKDSQGISSFHDPVTVDYAVVGGNGIFHFTWWYLTMYFLRRKKHIKK